jgi:Uma2 family endonuclease
MTVQQLHEMPDDGNRYELIDGELFVTPAPAPRHQEIVAELLGRLRNACPPGLIALSAPLAVQMDFGSETQPDVLVAHIEDFSDKGLHRPPLLAVEVLSPSTALDDLNNKKGRYERFGVPSYWVINPVEPDLFVFELDESGRYRITAKVVGDERFEPTQPFRVSFSVNELLGPFGRR